MLQLEEDFDADALRKTSDLQHWVKKHAKNYGTQVLVIEGHSEEGKKFCKGFGIAAILRYAVAFKSQREAQEEAL